MKNKKITTYLLLIASIIIWGSITWRLVKAFNKEEIVGEATPRRFIAKETDSPVFLLNYEDPFLKNITNETINNEQEFNDTDFYQNEPDVVHGPDFKFKGILKAGNKVYGLLYLNGETIMVSARERIGDFYIVSISSDKIIVRRQGLDMELFAE